MLSLQIANTLLKSLKNGSRSNYNMGRKFLSTASEIEERKIRVNEVDINYVRAGKGGHSVLLLPGALGCSWTDMKPQIEHLDREKFTVVAWDPPGQGKSRPPNRDYPDNFFQRDADWAHNLMKNLGYDKYSIFGWSDGGITGLMMAAKYKDSVQKLVASAANAYVTPKEAEIYKSIKNIDTWSEKMRAPMIAVYGEDYFRKTWTAWVDAMIRLFEKQNGNVCKEVLPEIICPTLIVYGKKDAMVLPEHATYLKNNIKNSRLEVLEKGAHNAHLRYFEEFNILITEFLLKNSKY